MNQKHKSVESVTFLCTECNNISKSNISLELFSSNQEISTFDISLTTICNKCGSVCEEVGDKIASTVALLREKGYSVLASNQGIYAPIPFNPHIVIDYPGYLPDPIGWETPGRSTSESIQVFVPEGSYGANQGDDIRRYITDEMFSTEEEFKKAQDEYIKSLYKWVEQLERSQIIRVSKQVADAINPDTVIDVDTKED